MGTSWGLGSGDFEPQPNFRASRDAEGKWVASHSYVMLAGSWEAGIKEQFVKGASISTFFSTLNLYWSFLELERFEVENRPGSLVEVFCEFTGFNPDEYESDREVTYILSGTRVERSILLHPLFIHEMGQEADVDQVVMAAAFAGEWAIDEAETISASSLTFKNLADAGRVPHEFTSTNSVKWAKTIFIQGHRTYKAPTLQWTRETANLAGLNNSDIERLGLEEFNEDDPPPGNPPVPFHGDFSWMKISLTDTRTSGASSNSMTWELSPPGGFHRFPGEEGIEGKGIYNYDLSDLE